MKKGISLMTLVITIVVMTILATTVSVSGVAVYNNYKKVKFATELHFIEQAVDSYYRYNNNYPILDSIVVDISKVSPKASAQFDGENIENGKITLYEIDKSLIGTVETVFGNKKTTDDVYALSYDTGKVYYVKGIKVSLNTFYSLTQELRKSINMDTIKNVGNTDNIIFNKKYSGYTNESETISLEIPDTYENISISVYSNGVLILPNVSTEHQSNRGKYIYTIDPIEQNCDIIVLFNKNKVEKKNIYHVENIDIVKPTFTILDPVKIQDKNGNYKYSIQLDNLNDDLSGIKFIKYENDRIKEDQLSTYFLNNGIIIDKVKPNILTDSTSGYITLYIEDNAGNFSYQYVNINNMEG